VQARDPPVERRARLHPGEDNGTRTPSASEEARDESCEAESSRYPYSRADNAASFPSTMSPSGWSQRWDSDWSARGDSNPDLHGLNVPRLPIAPRADDVGPSGWTRTTTTRVKSPACCVDTTEGVELIPGIEPGRRPYQGRRLPLHQISVGANGGIRTRTSRLGRPAGNRYPTFALVRPG
jgi:hypothetical protein